ncbi:MAG: PEP-utilizing enzyme [Actinomycetota bacterium]|nr:PEP-utilizing enzyme [Actinomycetota bacterium]
MAGFMPDGGFEDPPVLGLEAVDATMTPAVGGKAANLGEMISAGLPVPGGFAVTTPGYLRMAAAAGLDAVVHQLAGIAGADTAALAGAAAHARSLVLAAPESAELTAAVRTAYAELGRDVPVAVRSSATAEDLEFASFAGQQDTYLNVVGIEAVLDAVRRCWASLWTDRALIYRTLHGVDNSTVALAVVVQKMVDVSVAGVMFTANPVTGNRAETVIDASPGLGEAVVSGIVNPDHFVVRTDTSEIVARRLGGKGLLIRALPGGGTERLERTTTEDRACLTGGQIRALAQLGHRVQNHFGAPQDLEWAIDDSGSLWLTQSRPITTLYPLPARAPAGPEPRAYLCFSLAQGLTRPLTPMGLAGIRLIASSVAMNAGFVVDDPLAGPSAYTEAGQRIFIDVTSAVRSSVGRVIMPRVFDVMEARSAVLVRRLFTDPGFSVLSSSARPLLKRVGGVAVRARVPARALEALLRPTAALGRADRLAGPLAAFIAVPETATPEQRLDHVQRILGRVFPLLPAVLPGALAGFALLGLARKLLGGMDRPDELQTVLRGLPHNVTTNMDLDLWQLAVRLRTDPDSAKAFAEAPVEELARSFAAGTMPTKAQHGLSDFLVNYGHRAVAEIDLGMPRWNDDPTHIIGVVANYLRRDGPGPAPDVQFAQGAERAEAMVAELAARARTRGRLRGYLVRLCLGRARQLVGLRELPKNYLVLVLAAARRQLSAVGAALLASGSAAAPGDVFFLDLAEARRGLAGEDLKGLVAERRQAYDQELRRRHIPRLLLSDGTEPEAVAGNRVAAANGVLTGSPASAGTVTGKARVILDPVGAHLEPGEILIAPSTDPGWTPLFLTAGGLVMEMGGANSHGAVVAREYGIPAVVGVPDATMLIRTGAVVALDGAAGTVTPAG